MVTPSEGLVRVLARAPYLTATALLAAVCRSVEAETEVELRTRVISALRIVEVRPAPALAARYLGDADPRTIEVVRLHERGDGPSRVSQHGQVVYLGIGESTSKHREMHLNRAFEIHFRKARASGADDKPGLGRDR